MEEFSKNKKNISMTGIIVSLLVIGAVLAISYSKLRPNNLNPGLTNNQPLPISTKAPIKSHVLTIDGCNIKKEDNPLVQGSQKTQYSVLATLYGNISKINFNKASSTPSASIELTAPAGDQVYSFEVQDEPNLVFDAVALKNLKLTDLKQGLTLTVTLNCYPDRNNLLKYSQIAVMGDTTK